MIQRRFAFLLIGLLILVGIVAANVLAADVQLLICAVNPSESGSPRVFIGYESDTAYENVTTAAVLGRSGLFGAMPESVQAGHYPGLWGVEIWDGVPVYVEMYSETWHVSATVTGDEPSCEATGTGQPDGGLFQIVKLVEGEGDYLWEIYGEEHWHHVTTTAAELKGDQWQVVLVLGSDNQNHDAANYRVSRVEPSD